MRFPRRFAVAALLPLAACAATASTPAPGSAVAPSVAADTSRVYDGAQVDQKARLLNQREVANVLHARYPARLRESGWRGEVLVRAVVDENGVVTSHEILRRSGDRQVDAGALAALRTMRFHPAQHQGRRVRVAIELPITIAPGPS